MSSPGVSSWSRFHPDSLDRMDGLPYASASAGRRVLITGAGGSIGSALALAIAQAGPRRLVLLESSESGLFNLQRALEAGAPEAMYEAVLGSTLDVGLLDELFRRFHPEIVYHAAAFKHVPLLEQDPIAAVRNNAIGTWTLARAAVRHGASKLILISTDKAVNPRSVMGASKRIAELAVVALSIRECAMNAIRLVNVIGSSGSVVPTMLWQIATGQPITVTDSEAQRWFLSLRETVAAVLASGVVPCEGRILVPEAGEPIDILELAEYLKGVMPGQGTEELPIRFIGLRPGEKISEELHYDSEVNEGIAEGSLQLWRTRRVGAEEMEAMMKELSVSIDRRDAASLIRTMRALVPEYEPSEFIIKHYDPIAAG